MIPRLVMGALPFALGAALLAVLVHILTILIMPAVAARTGAQLLLARAAGPGVQLVPPARPGDSPTPFADPAMAIAVCAFDLGEGPHRIRAQTGDHFTSLVVVGASGDVLHGLTDKAAVRRSLDVLIGTEQQIRAAEAQDGEDRVSQEVRLRVSVQRGLVVMRSLAPRAADMPAAEEALKRAQCGVAAEP
jgi:uncharacterized membrane protein